MGNINFTGTFNTTQVDDGFDRIVDTTKATTKVVSSEFKKVSKSMGEAFKKVKPIPAPVSLDKIYLVRQMKKEIQDLESAAIAAGEGTKAWADAIERAGELKGQLADLKSAIKALDPDTKAAAFGNFAASSIESLNGVQGAFALLGAESENFSKALVRLQGVQAIAMSIRSFTGLSDQWKEARNSLSSYISKIEEKILADRISKAIVLEGTAEQLAASAAQVSLIEKEAAATQQATIATRLLNLAKTATPWGLVAVAIGVVVTAIAMYVSSSQAAVRADKIRNTATDGVIIKNKELREEYEKILIAEKKLNIDLEITAGHMSKLAGEIDKLKVDRISAIDEATKELNATLEEQNTWYNNLANSAAALATGQDAATIKLIKNAEQIKKIGELKLVEEKKLAAATKELEAKAAQESLENSREIEIERLKTKKDILEMGGKSTFDIQRQIIDQEQNLADLRAANEFDAEGIMILNAEKAAQQRLAIDKAEADARRQFRTQLNGLIIAQMSEGHQKELSLLEENQRELTETRNEFFNRENGTLKLKYEKDLAVLNESLRTQREVILNDASLSGGQKNALIKELTASFDKQRLDLEIKFQDDKVKIEKEYDQKRFDEQQKNLDALTKAKQNNIQFEVDMIDAQGEIENAALKDQLNKKIITQAEYDKQVQKNELAAIVRRRDAVLAQDQLELDRLQQKLHAEQALKIDNEETVKQLDAAKKKMSLDTLKFQGEVAGKEVDLTKEKNKLISDENKKHAEEAFNVIVDSVDKIIAAQEESLNLLKERNDAAIAENDRYISALTDQLKEEQDAREAGYASNVLQVQRDLEAEKAARKQNLEDQKAIQAEQDKLAKIKLISDKAQQASAIVSAIANIYANQSTLGPIGVAIASVSVAAMLVAFASFKKKIPGFAKGTKKAPAGLKWVGEQGPELINDAGGYRIFTNKESQNIINNYPNVDFSSKIPQYDFTSKISSALRPGNSTDTKGIERGIKQTNQLLEQGMNEPKIIYDGDRKIVSKGASTTITKTLNGRR